MPAVERISDRLERMAIANAVAEYIGVDRGMVLDSFRKAVVDRKEIRIERSKETIRADERGCSTCSSRMWEAGTNSFRRWRKSRSSTASRPARIFRAILAAHASGAPTAFDAISARLEPADQNLLAELALSEDAETHENTLEYGRQCWRACCGRAMAIGARSKGARQGCGTHRNLGEALRLARELQEFERGARRADDIFRIKLQTSP